MVTTIVWAWNNQAMDNAIFTLGQVQKSLLDAVDVAEANDTINFSLTNTFLSPDMFLITIHDINQDGLPSYGGKYYKHIETGVMDHSGKLAVHLVVAYAIKNREVDNPITYTKTSPFSSSSYSISGGQWFRDDGGSVNPCNVYAKVCSVNQYLPEYWD